MQTVCELKSFERAAQTYGIKSDEVSEIIEFIALNPSIGDEIKSTGGCRKVRFSGRGKGKSGGYRVITFYTGPDLPVFLITIFAKGDKASISQAEAGELSKLTTLLKDAYKRSVKRVGDYHAHKGI